MLGSFKETYNMNNSMRQGNNNLRKPSSINKTPSDSVSGGQSKSLLSIERMQSVQNTGALVGKPDSSVNQRHSGKSFSDRNVFEVGTPKVRMPVKRS